MSDNELGQLEAYRSMYDYALSMVGTADDPKPWVDMAFYAHASIEDLIDPVDIA